jgi:formiminotetrahydrofolate cyclodeaminase
MEALRLPKTTPEQALEKEKALEEATKEATLVPLEVMERCGEAAHLAGLAASKGYRNSLSDAGVGGLTAAAAGEGAYLNILINLPTIRDEKFKARVRRQADRLKAEMDRTVRAIRKVIGRELERPKA